MDFTLLPLVTAEIASNVYDIKQHTDSLDKAFIKSSANTYFNLTGNSSNPALRLRGTSGGNIIRKETGFGIFAQGKALYKNQALLAFRGTAGMLDLVTDSHLSPKLNQGSQLVHAGFQKTFDSLFEQVKTALALRESSIDTIHIVGHSLGGAIATLYANWISQHLNMQVKLYTFGSPRVGMDGFSKTLTRRLGADNIHRTYHRTDIIPMIPLWPYYHTPFNGIDCYLDSPGFPGLNYHSMQKYKDRVAGQTSWRSLHRAAPHPVYDQLVKDMFATGSVHKQIHGGFYLLNRSMTYVFDKLNQMGLIVIQAVLMTGATAWDLLALTLQKAASISLEAHGLITTLMKQILKTLGRAITVTSNLTYAFIKAVFDMMNNVLYKTAREALKIVHNAI